MKKVLLAGVLAAGFSVVSLAVYCKAVGMEMPPKEQIPLFVIPPALAAAVVVAMR
ncbi:MAG: hypothetical protein QXR87_03330 [Candidatus Hadarchaeales archaeon]